MKFLRVCYYSYSSKMEPGEGELVPTTICQSEEVGGRWSHRSKRQVKKKISLVYLLKVICASQETCLDWLKNRGLIPKIMFCPNCSRKMKFEAEECSIDGYVWVCKECRIDPPQYSARHGSWLEDKDAPLLDILLFTYLWSHGFNEEQIMKETNMSLELVQDWSNTYIDICASLHRKSTPLEGDEYGDENILEISNKESPESVWRRKNKYKDPFLEFLKDADSL